MRLTILSTLLLSTLTQADTRLILGGFSYHLYDAPFHYNEVHPAIGIEKNNIEVALTINSVDEPSVMIGKVGIVQQFYDIDFGYRIGLGTGYNHKLVKKDPLGDDCQFNDSYQCKGDVYYTNPIAVNGIQPFAQLLFRKELPPVTIDFGLSTVSTLIFKVDV